MLLAIDTSAGTSVAVVDRDAGVISEVIETDTMRHAEVIGTLIDEALRVADVPVAALSGVVAGMGPGPFTGLRVGIAAAKAFAIGAGKPLVPVVSHDAVAYDLLASGRTGPFLVVTDARRRERYWTAYSGADAFGLPIRLDGPGLAKPDDLPHPALDRMETDVVPAGRLGMIAELRYANRLPMDRDEALYLRSPDVTLSAGPKRVTA